MASTIFLVHVNGCHYMHLSVRDDIQEPPPPGEEEKSMEEEPDQRDESNPILDSELVTTNITI